MTVPAGVTALLLAVALAVASCSRTVSPVNPPSPTKPPLSTSPTASAASGTDVSKVLLIAEENHGYDQIIGSPDAPYLNRLADAYGVATHLDAGYPAACPSLAAYILLTSGTTAGICDDRGPTAHPLRGDNVFHQVAASGREWRDYAQAALGPCALDNSRDGRYLVRHVPATYYLDERQDCARWSVPLGEPDAGALHEDVAAGTLPAFAFISPDACHDMHGAGPCPVDRVGKGDRWLQAWLPAILAGADYRAGRLAIIITWDEGTGTDNHIPTLVISPTTEHVTADQAFTHCSTLRTVQELLGLPLLGCAARAPSMASAFRLDRPLRQ
jgi:phosphatidylinositol-3-phosphatase